MAGRPAPRKGVLPIIVSSIIKKRRGGRTYLYAATSARVGGRPRIVEQVYLGAEDEVIARLTAGPGEDPSVPETEHRRFGDGIVVSSRIVKGDEEVTVAFVGEGVKRLIAAYAGLERA